MFKAPPGQGGKLGRLIKKKFLYIAFILLLMLLSCKSKDEESPVVELVKPRQRVVCNVCEVLVNANDNVGVVKTEIYLDNQLVQSADDSICVYQWNTRSVSDNSSHIIYAYAYDLEGNKGYSDTVSVIAFNNLDNTEIFIWLYDHLDVFYDSTIQQSIDCSYWLEQTIIANGYNCDKLYFLPPDLSSYKVGFVTLGWERC